jgi:hypothetical protein
MADLAWVADRIAIQDVLIRYCRGVDRLDVDLLRSVFWPDAEVEYGAFKGNGLEWTQRAVPSLRDGYDGTQHAISNSFVQLDGDVAHVETYVHAYHLLKAGPDEPRRVFFWVGRHIDRFEKRDGEWKIGNRVVMHDFDRVDQINETMPDSFVASYAQGRRDREDRSYTHA